MGSDSAMGSGAIHAAAMLGLLVLPLGFMARALPAQSVPAADPAPSPGEGRPPLPPPGEMARLKGLIDAGLHRGARMRLEPIVDQHPRWARARLLLGLTYYRESRFEAANEHFARALEADPEELAVRPFYGWSLYALGQLDAAQRMFESVLRRKPAYTPAHYALGLIHLDRDDIDAARETLTTTVRLAGKQGDPSMAGRAHGRLGDLYLRLDDLAAAKRQLDVALELFPEDLDALFTLSRVLQRLGDAEGAAEARRKVEEARAKRNDRSPRYPGG